MATGGTEIKTSFRTCRRCFYLYRLSPEELKFLPRGQRCKRCHRYGGIQAILRDQIYETTKVRKNQQCKDRPVKCDPTKVSCKGDDCPYAHGEEELESWQKHFLKDYSGGPEITRKTDRPASTSKVEKGRLNVGCTDWPDIVTMVPDKSHSLAPVQSKEDEFHSSSNNNNTVSHEIPSAQDRASHEDLNQTLQQAPSKAMEVVKDDNRRDRTSLCNKTMDNPSDYDWQQDGSLSRTNQDQNVQEFYIQKGKTSNRREIPDKHADKGSNPLVKEHERHMSVLSGAECVPLTDLKSPLTFENYKAKFHHLLHLEEAEHNFQLDKKELQSA